MIDEARNFDDYEWTKEQEEQLKLVDGYIQQCLKEFRKKHGVL